MLRRPVTPTGWFVAVCVVFVTAGVAAGRTGAVAQEQSGDAQVKAPDEGKPASKGKGEERKPFGLPGADKKEPIHIDAAILEYDSRENVAVFRGDVVTTQGDVVVHSALLRVMLSGSSTPGSPGRAEGVVAEGNVRIVQGERVAVGNRAEFNDADRTVVLSGDAVLHEGENEVRGERVIVYLDEERSVVEGTNTRVKAILMPKDEPEEEGQTTAQASTGDGAKKHANHQKAGKGTSR